MIRKGAKAMLVPAITKKEDLEELFSAEIYKEDFFYYTGWAHTHELPDIKPKNNVYQWAIMDGEKVVGYLAYDIDLPTDCVCSFGLYSFDRGNPVIGRDLLKEMERLVKTHHRLEWRCIEGNPVERHYAWFCERHGGEVSILHDYCRDMEGHYRDCYIYEVIDG